LPFDALLPIVTDRSYTPTTRNDAANRLLNRGDRQLAGRLIRMLRDETEDLTWRNYCIQFLRGCYEQQTKQPTTTWGVSRDEILAALFEGCAYSEPELSSCAIWSLAQLASPKPWANRVPGAAKLNAPLLPEEAETRIKRLALEALRDPKGHLLVRTGGAQSCARMGQTEAAPDLRKIATDDQAGLSIRTVAIAGLGQLKDEASRDLLTRLANDPSPRLKQAAQMALKRLGTTTP